MVRSDSADFAVRDLQRGLGNFSAEQRPAAFDKNITHDTALRRGVGERSALVATSYFARNSSTANCRKSGKARRSLSWSQSHHARAASRLVTASENRRLMVRAGFPPTMV